MRVIVKPAPFKPSQIFTLGGVRLGEVDTIDLRDVDFLPGGTLEGSAVYSYGVSFGQNVHVDPRELGIGLYRMMSQSPRVERQMFRDYAWKNGLGTAAKAERAVVTTGKVLLGGAVRWLP